MEVYDFGERVRKYRELRNLTQEELGLKIGVSRNSIAKYESNIANPKIDVLTRLSIVLGTTSDYLLGLDEEPTYLKDLSSEQNQIIYNAKNLINDLTKEFQSKNKTGD